MKHFSTILLLVVVFLISTFSTSFAQLPWTKDINNPIMSGGASGTWNRHVFVPSVLYNTDSSRYEMWFSASDGPSNWEPYRIGFATSNDGINWTMPVDTAVLSPTPGTWDESSVLGALVIRENGQYKMWYTGWTPTSPDGIGYATSTNGINWTKYPGNPVMGPGTAAWEAGGSAYGIVMPVQGGGYKMWYTGSNANWTKSQIGYATSSDGITWTRADSVNPVLTTGSPGQWDDTFVYWSPVFLNNNIYHMWYSGMRASDNPRQTGWASSIDGIHWNKYNDPITTGILYADSDPVLTPTYGQWDGNYVQATTVMLEGDSLRMWYQGSRENTGTYLWRIGHATAPLTMPVTILVPRDVPTIQAAIDSASDGNVVLVADGTYLENINFKGKAITVASHYYIDGDTSHISNTIIDGSQSTNPDSGSTVYFVSGEDTNSVLCGFTITGGTGTPTTLFTNNYRSGGGIFCVGVTGAKIINNHIKKNSVSGDYAAGGGLLFQGDNSFLILEENRISDNYVFAELAWGIGGGAEITGDGLFARVVENVFERDTIIAETYAWGGGSDVSGDQGLANGIVQGNVFRDNIAEAKVNNGIAGGFGCFATETLEIRDNHFEGNIAKSRDAHAEGGGMLIDDEYLNNYGRKLVVGNHFINNKSIGTYGSGGGLELFRTLATVSGNYFEQNSAQGGTAYGGAIRIALSAFLLENNIITNNTAKTGGAVRIAGSPQLGSGLEMINNTIVNNIASSTGGGVYVSSVQATIRNSIIWGNSPNQIIGSVAAQYNDIQGGLAGTGNINADPLFADSIFYELSETSPCVGTGTDSLAPPFDYGGDPRPNPVDEYVDIGAQESPYPKAPDIIKEDSDNLPKTFSLKQNYPNPFNPKTNIQFSIPKTEFVTLKIYNLLGQEVATLVSDKLTPGSYKYTWDASHFASGVYMYKIKAGNFVKTKKLILLK